MVGGGSSAPVAYTSSPTYRALRFRAHGGESIQLWVHAAAAGSGVAWIVDGSLRTVTSSDRGYLTTALPGVRGELATWYVVFR